MKEVTYEKIVEIVQLQINKKRILPEQFNDDLGQLGMGSLEFIQIIVALERYFECEIPDTKLVLSEMNTINKIYLVLINEAISLLSPEDS